MYDVEIPAASELMERAELILSPEGDLLGAIEELAERRASAAPVLDERRLLLGMLTEKDCLRILAVATFDEAVAGTVGDYMSVVKLAVEPSMDLFRVAELFLGTNFPMLPVVEDGKLLGVISRQGLLRAIQRLRHQVARELARSEAAAGEPQRPRSIEQMQKVFGRLSREQLVRVVGRKSD